MKRGAIIRINKVIIIKAIRKGVEVNFKVKVDHQDFVYMFVDNVICNVVDLSTGAQVVKYPLFTFDLLFSRAISNRNKTVLTKLFSTRVANNVNK
jgi:hypothetical protein